MSDWKIDENVIQCERSARRLSCVPSFDIPALTNTASQVTEQGILVAGLANGLEKGCQNVAWLYPKAKSRSDFLMNVDQGAKCIGVPEMHVLDPQGCGLVFEVFSNFIDTPFPFAIVIGSRGAEAYVGSKKIILGPTQSPSLVRELCHLLVYLLD